MHAAKEVSVLMAGSLLWFGTLPQLGTPRRAWRGALILMLVGFGRSHRILCIASASMPAIDAVQPNKRLKLAARVD